jgi:hypothetical protein
MMVLVAVAIQVTACVTMVRARASTLGTAIRALAGGKRRRRVDSCCADAAYAGCARTRSARQLVQVACARPTGIPDTRLGR